MYAQHKDKATINEKFVPKDVYCIIFILNIIGTIVVE